MPMERVMVVKRARITVETDTIVVVRQARTKRAWCPWCQAVVDAITLDGANLPETCAAAQIQEWLNTRELHLWQQPEGPLQICLGSLLRCFEQELLPKSQNAKETT